MAYIIKYKSNFYEIPKKKRPAAQPPMG